MFKEQLYWMNFSISIADKASFSKIKVGSVLVSDNNDLLCYAYSGEKNENPWNVILMDKVQELNIARAKSLYLTINTQSENRMFSICELLEKIYIEEIYIGLPDPNLSDYRVDDPVLSFQNIYRYTDEMQCRILEQNFSLYSKSSQSIRGNSFYAENRISDLIIAKLKQVGYEISLNELYENKQREAVANLISDRYGIGYFESSTIVYNIISEAFNDKYSSYNYLDDTRSIAFEWKENFLSCYERASRLPLGNNKIINVGVGSGYEAIKLFSDCNDVTYVDIARGGLENIKKQMSDAKVILSSADDLTSMASESYDLYVSLRTYNSSFFNLKKALLEARRVLKEGGVIIVSIANGFLCAKKNCTIPGLIIPGTEFVDIYRGIDTIKIIHTELDSAGFKNIQIFPTVTEIYISAVLYLGD